MSCAENDLARVIQGDDVGVLQRGGDLDLPEEALPSQGDRELGLEHFQRDGATVLEIGGEEHHGHAAVAELALDPVAVADSYDKLVEERHGPGLLAATGNVEIPGRKRYMGAKVPAARIGRRALPRVVTRRPTLTPAARTLSPPPSGARPCSCP